MTGTAQLSGASATLAGTRVFLAEDDPMILFVLEAVVEGLGCSVAGTAARVADALAFLETGAVDVAIVDLTLADGDAAALVAALAARRTPVIVTSGALPAASGPDGPIFLRKPYTERDLHKALLGTLARTARGLAGSTT